MRIENSSLTPLPQTLAISGPVRYSGSFATPRNQDVPWNTALLPLPKALWCLVATRPLTSMRLGRNGACRASVLCTAVRTPPTVGCRPRLRHSLRRHDAEGSCSRPLLIYSPLLEGASEGASSSSNNSSSSSSWQLPPQLGFVELRDSPPFSVQVGEPEQQQQAPQPPPRPDQEKHKDYYANVGDCIRTLREDVPLLFVKDLNYSIYREDIVFKDPRISFRGLKNYKLIMWSLRFHGNLFFKSPMVEILRIWQPEDNIIKMRWTVHACPRLWGDRSVFDGISTYKLDKNGTIYEHAIDNMQLRDPPITNPLLYGWNFVANTLVPQQAPCPGAFFREECDDALPHHLPGSVAPAGQQ